MKKNNLQKLFACLPDGPVGFVRMYGASIHGKGNTGCLHRISDDRRQDILHKERWFQAEGLADFEREEVLF